MDIQWSEVRGCAMIEQLKRIFGGETSTNDMLKQGAAIELATAALLIELAHADASVEACELQVVHQLLQHHFGVSGDSLRTLMADAASRLDDAASLHELTYQLDRELSHTDKLAVIEMLWRVSNADGHIDTSEEQLIARIAGLLHINDRDRMRLKLKVVVSGG
jgi:uncharacterized tellurite resistance protein B-like protein